MKHVVHLLHTALHMPEHHMLKERQLLERQDVLKQELSPLEEVVDTSQHLHLLHLSLSLVHPCFCKGTEAISVLLVLLADNLLLVSLPGADR